MGQSMNICRAEQEHPDMIDIKVGGNGAYFQISGQHPSEIR